MPKLPVVSGAAVVQALSEAGFAEVGQRGSHVRMRENARTVIVPLHRELATGTLMSVLRQAALSADGFRALL